MHRIAAEVARIHTFDEKTLRLSLAEIARRSYGDGSTVNQALEEGSKHSVSHAMADGIMIQAEESRLSQFFDRLALADFGTDPDAEAQLERESTDPLTLDARLAAVAVEKQLVPSGFRETSRPPSSFRPEHDSVPIQQPRRSR